MPPRRNDRYSSLLPAAHIHSQSLQVTPSQSYISNGISQSTASLPPRYTISLAIHNDTTLSDTERYEKYKQGEEFLADSWRRPGESQKEGIVGDRKRKRRVAFPGHDLASQDEGILDLRKGGVLWYTAGLKFPCSCQLTTYPNAYTFIRPPPLQNDLPDLPSYPNPDLIPEVGTALGNWIEKSHDTFTDLGPCMNELEEFEIGWVKANGASWNMTLPPVKDGITPLMVDSGITVVESPESRRRRKGKQKALDPYTPHLAKRLSVIPETPQYLIPPNISLPTPTDPREEIADRDWITQSKKRKLLRQVDVLQKPYGDVFNIIPRPHDLHSFIPPYKRPKSTKQPRPPDYILPRFFTHPHPHPSPRPHPYHPSLSNYITSNPHSRIYWLIPIHGPILIPIPGSKHLHPKTPTPSSGILTTSPPQNATTVLKGLSQDGVIASKGRPADITWTPSILRHFWDKFLIPLHASCQFGNLAIRISGPKPDPFIDLLPPKLLLSHLGVGVRGQEEHGDGARPGVGGEGGVGGGGGVKGGGGSTDVDPGHEMGPVRPEMGDHFRIYCDARMALSLRTWLNGVEIDLNRINEADPEQCGMTGKGVLGGKKGSFRLFEKVRLVLVGERGEALIVA